MILLTNQDKEPKVYKWHKNTELFLNQIYLDWSIEEKSALIHKHQRADSESDMKDYLKKVF